MGSCSSFAQNVVIASFFVTLGCFALAQTPQLPPNYPKAQYDESKVPQYTLPDPLLLLNGKKVKNTKTWIKKRRPELLKLFATNIYGRTMVGRPKDMTWEVISTDTKALEAAAITKTVAIYFVGKKDGPKMDLRITLPARAQRPTRIFLVPAGDRYVQALVSHGYGLATFTPASIEADNKDGYAKSVRAFFAPGSQKEPGPDEWGALGAWAWGMSRAMDYLMTDPDVDGRKVSIMGFSRFGKAAMWAGAQDERFAIVFSGESGCGGANIVRRQYGETIKLVTAYAPFWFDANFKSYADRVNDLPLDWHMLIALMAPRPVYIATAEQDYWGDPRGSFLAAKAAEPVYKLFGKAGLGVNEMPPVETPVGDTIGYHNRKGTHGVTDYDWQQFLAFADRHFGIAKTEN
jgi:(4-O-methyl)-D-glucuronate---lignin esterase